MSNIFKNYEEIAAVLSELDKNVSEANTSFIDFLLAQVIMSLM